MTLNNDKSINIGKTQGNLNNDISIKDSKNEQLVIKKINNKSDNNNMTEQIKMSIEGTNKDTLGIDNDNAKNKSNRKYRNQYNNINNIESKVYNKKMQTYEQFKAKNIKSLNKDLPLKYYAKLLLNSMGYYCDMEVNMLTQSFNQKYKKEQISDIDVLGFKIENDLSISIVPVECKSGENGALDELLKLKGIMDYLKSYKGYLIKTKIAANAREMGEKIKISTFDYNEIRKLLNNLSLLELTNDKWIENQIENYLKEKYIYENSIKFTRIIEYLKNEYWHQQNYRNIQNIIYFLNNPKENNIFESNEGKYILLQLSKYLSLSIIQLSSYVISKNYNNPIDKIKEYMFGGARERREREMLFDKVNQILASQSRQPQSFEPSYLDDFTEICLRFISIPNFAKQVPACIECIIQTFIIENIGYDKDTFVNKFKSISLKLSKDIIIFVCKQSNVNTNIFAEILNL